MNTTNTRLDEPISSACPTRIVAFEPTHAERIVELIPPIRQMEVSIPVSLNDQPDLQDVTGFYQRGCGASGSRRQLAQLVGWCTTHAVREVYVGTTAKFLAAHRLYEKNGCIESPRSELPEAFPAMVMDTRFYHRAF